MSTEQLDVLMHDAHRHAWSVAALVLALSGQGTDAQRRSARALLTVLGVDPEPDVDGRDPDGVAADAAAPVLQAAALLSGQGDLWAAQPDAALVAQGRASGQGAPRVAALAVPLMPGLAEELGRPGARMLDVGTGIAALAVGWAQTFPALTVVGLDALPRVLALAQDTLAGSGVEDRVVLRHQDVRDLDERDTYALAWLPAPFLDEDALRAGSHAVAAALRPGGWVLLAHGRFRGDPVDDAVSRFTTTAFGGTALDDGQAQDLLREAGLEEVTTLPTPSGAPGITVGRRSGRAT